MKKKSRLLLQVVIVLVSVIIGWPFSSGGQETAKVRLAIVDFTTTSQEPEHTQLEKVVPEWLTTFFVKKQTFDVIERRQLEAILQEQTLGQTGLLNEQSVAEVGQVLGVDMLVTGSIISIADTLEVTARVIDAETGAIAGVANLVADDVEELREEIDTLGNILITAIRKGTLPEDVKVFEPFDDDTLDMNYWSIDFDEEMTSHDKANTKWHQEDGILRMTGTYQGEDEHRGTWIFPHADEPYTSIEVNLRVNELDGDVEVCVGASWSGVEDDDEAWTGICPYFSDNYGDITVFLEDKREREEEIGVDVRVGPWYRIRLQAQDNQLLYYLNDTVLTTISPDIPVSSSEGFWLDLGVYLSETQTVTVEFDDLILQ